MAEGKVALLTGPVDGPANQALLQRVQLLRSGSR